MDLKSCLIIILCNLASICSSGQQFNTRFDASQLNTSEVGFDIEFVNGQPVAVVSSLFPTQNKTAFVFLNNDGQPTEYKYLDDPVLSVYPGWCNAVATTQEGGYVHGGSISGVDQGVFAALLDSNADTLWTRTITWEGDSTTDIGNKAKIFDNEILIVGRQGNKVQLDGIALKLDLDGNLIWKKKYGGEGNESFTYFEKSHDEGYFLSGTTRTLGGPDADAWLVKIDDDGEEEWSIVFDTEDNSPAAQVVATQDGNYVLVISSYDGQYEQISMMKIDEDGDEIWTKEYGSPHPQWVIFSAKELSDGDLILCGRRWEPIQIMGFLMKCNADGDSLWSRTYSAIPDNYCELRDVVPNDFGGFTAIGYNYLDPSEDIEQDTWVIQTDSLGCIVPGCGVGVGELEDQLSIRVYPNPAQDKINIVLPPNLELNQGILDIVDVSGQIIRRERLFHNTTVSIPLLGVMPGIYLLRFSSDEVVITEKFVAE